LRDLRAIVFDLDGCIYRGSEPVRGAAEAVEHFRKKGMKILFMTNNSTRSPGQYASKLKSMGIRCEAREVLTSGTATALYLSRRYGKSKLFVVGEKALRDELRKRGHTLVRSGRADFVVAGLDRSFDYRKLTMATQAIHAGARFVATNTDATIPIETGLLPGAGSIVASISAATGAEALVVGKPHRPILEIAMSLLQEPAGRMALVGDRLETDIASGLMIGAYTVLVLSGATVEGDLAKRPEIRPHLVVEDVSELPSKLVL